MKKKQQKVIKTNRKRDKIKKEEYAEQRTQNASMQMQVKQELSQTFTNIKLVSFRQTSGTLIKTFKCGSFKNSQAKTILYHRGSSLQECQFVVEWYPHKGVQPHNTIFCYRELLEMAPSLLLEYIEKYVQLD